MSDIFQEVEQELRRDRLQSLWDRYGILLISGAIGLVLIVASVEIYQAWRTARNEASSARYMALLEQTQEASEADRAAAFETFITEEQGGYRVLAQFQLAADQAEKGDWEAAARGYEAIAANGQLPIAVRDYANLQAATVSLSHVAVEDIEARLKRMLTSSSGLQGAAREVMGLAYLVADQPIMARDILQRHLDETASTPPMRVRAEVLLNEANHALRSQPASEKSE
jgi:hypothetical protein